jgi:hypothetical protein
MKTYKDGGDPSLLDLAANIAYIVKQYDPNGIDLRFLQSDEKLDKCKSSKEVRSKIRFTPFAGMTDISLCLRSLLGEYKQRIDDWTTRKRKYLVKLHKKPNPITFYIFTDGVWQAAENRRQPEYGQSPIFSMVSELEKHGWGRNEVGIQFISFGNNEDGLRRLETLDNLGSMRQKL